MPRQNATHIDQSPKNTASDDLHSAALQRKILTLALSELTEDPTLLHTPRFAPLKQWLGVRNELVDQEVQCDGIDDRCQPACCQEVDAKCTGDEERDERAKCREPDKQSLDTTVASDLEEPPPDTEAALREIEFAKKTTGNQRVVHLSRAIEYHPASRYYIERGEELMEQMDYTSALADAEKAAAHGNTSARGLRLLANAAWMCNKARQAYEAMCEAQSLDFCEEFDPLHRQMRQSLAVEESRAKAVPKTQSLPSDSPTGLDMQSLMQSPMVQQMTQTLLQNPQMMSQMMQSVLARPE